VAYAQISVKHGTVTNACVSRIEPALPEKPQRKEVNIMKRFFLASAGILALGGVANASGWPPMLQKNGQELYAAPLAVQVSNVRGNSSTTVVQQNNSATVRGNNGTNPVLRQDNFATARGNNGTNTIIQRNNSSLPPGSFQGFSGMPR
jgi:hypothetical protein